MPKLNLSDQTPREYLAVPRLGNGDNEFSMVLRNCVNHVGLSKFERGTLSDTEFMAGVADEYLGSAEGAQDLATLNDLSYKLSAVFTEAFDVLTGPIADMVSLTVADIDKQAQANITTLLGYQNESGEYTTAAPKLYLLDIEDIFTSYKGTSVEFANRLCKKYSYNTPYLNDTNVAGLISRLNTTNDIDVNTSTLKAILEDVVINVTAKEDGDVVIETSDPNDVNVEGATPNTHIEDDQSSSTAGEGENTEGDTTPEPVNVNVKTDDDNANVNVNINGDIISTEEKELLAKIVNACFSVSGFNALRSSIFSAKSRTGHKNITDALFFIRRNIRDLMEDAAAKHLSDTQMQMLRSNFEAMFELQQSGVVFLDISAVRYANKLIIGPNLLNKNMVNKALADGVDIYPLVRNYLRVYHNKNVNDLLYDQLEHKEVLSGVAYDKVLSSTYAVEQRLVNAKQATTKRYQEKIGEARLAAFRTVMVKKIQDIANSSTEAELGVGPNQKGKFIADCHKLISMAMDELRRDPNANAEDALYNIIIRRWYSGTLVADIYAHLHEGVRDLASSGKLDEQSLAMVKAKAIAELGTKYLFDKFV